MRKLCLTVVGLYIGLLGAFSQTLNDSSVYKKKTLTLDEVNFVTSYYHQEGDHSPVTGGIGTEKLSDFATTIELKLNKYDKKNLKHELALELGVDHYTSASSDKIDPRTISSASSNDTRIYPSAAYTVTNEKTGKSFGANASYSNEYDYQSYGAGISFAKTSIDKNREFSVRLQAYLDNVSLILPVELRTGLTGRGKGGYPLAPRNSYSTSMVFSQAVNKRLEIAFLLDLIYQSGYLGTPFHRIYFSNGSESNEHLPSSRFKIPIALRANFFASDKLIIRTFYRYYKDDWGLSAHTLSLDLPVKLTSFFSVSPFYRYYTQSAVNYYAPYKAHKVSEQFYTTDDDLSPFSSNTVGIGFRMAQPGGVFSIKHLNALELRFAHYDRNDGLNSNILTLSLKMK